VTAAVLGLVTLLALVLAVWRIARVRRERRAYGEPFPPAWRAQLERTLPLYRRLPQDLRMALEPAVRRFLSRVQFIGCSGLEVTDEMRLVVALQASLLVLRGHRDAYDTLYSVLLYPDEFLVAERDEDEAGVVTEGERALSGQTLDTARIVLSWRDVQQVSAGGEAYNVVLHEFAHYLDHRMEGAISAPLARQHHSSEWHVTLTREFQALCAAVDAGSDTLIDPYGAEEPAEFFAVATETFFEQPVELTTRHPALYGALKRFYGLDPARW
jgi:MtfA peptidase